MLKTRSYKLYCHSRATRSTLVLGCTFMIHLEIQWPRIQCFRAYSQHQHGRIQGLCPTLPTYLFTCSRDSHSTQNISSMMCFKVHAQHKQAYIYQQQLAYAQYIKQIIVFICSGVFDPIYQNKTSR